MSPETAQPALGFAGYRRVLSAPGAPALIASSALARMPGGMCGLALVLYVHGVTGSFAAAGLVTGAFTIGFGGTAPLLARMIDRCGSRPVLIPAALVSSAALVLLVVLGQHGAGTGPLAAAAALAGAGIPPIGGIVRRRWPDLIEPAALPTAYAVDAILIEAIFISGPLLTGLLAATAGPAAAVYAAAGLGLLGVVLFDGPARVAGAGRDQDTHWLGALRSPPLRLMVLAGMFTAVTFGALDVALPAFGADHGTAALGGPFGAALAFGSALGGIAFGARPGAFGPPPRALLRLGGLAALTCLPLLLAASVAEMFVAAAISGLCVAPLVTVRNQLVQGQVGTGSITEAFTWITLSGTLGLTLGSALVGPLVEAAGWRAGAAVAALAPALATAILFLRRDDLLED